MVDFPAMCKPPNMVTIGIILIQHEPIVNFDVIIFFILFLSLNSMSI